MRRSIAPREVTLKPTSPPPAVLHAGMLAKQLLPLGKHRVTLFEDKISVHDTMGDSDALPRRYRLTHTDRSNEIFLTVGPEYDQEAWDQPQTRQMRDEVLAELTGGERPRLSVSCLVNSEELNRKAADPALRRQIFEKEMPFALAVIRYGDRFFFERHPELDQAQVFVEFCSTGPQYRAPRDYGRVTDYRVTRITGASRRLMVAVALAAAGIGALVVSRMRKR